MSHIKKSNLTHKTLVKIKTKTTDNKKKKRKPKTKKNQKFIFLYPHMTTYDNVILKHGLGPRKIHPVSS